jgi:uncharacterized membrane protein HdeD (DUF308 family)
MLFYDNGTDYREEIRDFWNSSISKFRKTAIIAGIVMIALGIVGIIWPIQSAAFVGYLMAAALIVFGIAKIVGYTKMPTYFRLGLGLVDGILDVLLGVMLIFSGTGTILYTLAFFFAFELIATGIEHIAVGNRMKFFGFGSTGSFTAGGVIDLIVGTILLFMPGASLVALGTIVIFFLITKGIILIIDGVKAKELRA